jgi:hypothetical protein
LSLELPMAAATRPRADTEWLKLARRARLLPWLSLLCAGQAAAALLAVATAGASPYVDPIAALVIAAIAVREGLELWRGEDSCCSPPVGVAPVDRRCDQDCCA